LEELRQVGDPVERRGIEFQMRPQAATRLRETAHHYANQASSSDPKLAHIASADKQKVLPLAYHCEWVVVEKHISKLFSIVVGKHYISSFVRCCMPFCTHVSIGHTSADAQRLCCCQDHLAVVTHLNIVAVQVLDECQAALGWLEEKENLQNSMKKTEDPVLVTADIKKKEETLSRVADPILTKPPPKPKVIATASSIGLMFANQRSL